MALLLVAPDIDASQLLTRQPFNRESTKLLAEESEETAERVVRPLIDVYCAFLEVSGAALALGEAPGIMNNLKGVIEKGFAWVAVYRDLHSSHQATLALYIQVWRAAAAPLNAIAAANAPQIPLMLALEALESLLLLTHVAVPVVEVQRLLGTYVKGYYDTVSSFRNLVQKLLSEVFTEKTEADELESSFTRAVRNALTSFGMRKTPTKANGTQDETPSDYTESAALKSENSLVKSEASVPSKIEQNVPRARSSSLMQLVRPVSR